MSGVRAVQFLCRWILVGPVLFVVGRPKVRGHHHIPRGPVILAANHLAVVDSLYLALAARRAVFFVAKSEYYSGAGLRGFLTRRFMLATGQIPVDRRGGDGARPAIDAAVGVLTRGGAWGIHPEGTRSPDGRMYRGHTGAVRVAMLTAAPLVPVAITGTAAGRLGRRVTITLLPPLDLSRAQRDADGVRRATDELMRIVATETGQVCVAAYARRDNAGQAPRDTAV